MFAPASFTCAATETIFDMTINKDFTLSSDEKLFQRRIAETCFECQLDIWSGAKLKSRIYLIAVNQIEARNFAIVVKAKIWAFFVNMEFNAFYAGIVVVSDFKYPKETKFWWNNYIDHFYKTWDFFLWILLVRQQLIHRKDMVENILHKLFQFEFSFQLGKINTCKNHLFEEDRANPANASFNKTLILQGNAKVISECEKYLNLMV